MTFAHGNSGYCNHGCRCEVCVAGKRAVRAMYRKRIRDKVQAGAALFTHGTYGYQHMQCRCDVCKAAQAAYYLANKAKWR